MAANDQIANQHITRQHIASSYIDWIDFPLRDKQRLASMQFQLSQTAIMPPAKLHEQALRAVRRLLGYASTHSEFYRDDARYADIASTEALSSFQEQFSQLPVLTRKDIQAEGSRLFADVSSIGHGQTNLIRTSGSTGRPIEIKTTQRVGAFWQAFTLRDHLWHRRDFERSLSIIKFSGGKFAYPGVSAPQWGPAVTSLFTTGECFQLDSLTPVTQQWSWLKAKPKGYLLTYPALLRELAVVNNDSLEPIKLSGVTTIGENLAAESKKLAESSFDCKVADIYSAQEVGYIALSCPYDDHYHVQSESCYVETLDEDNHPLSDGIGKVVVTPLHNFATPLIRYEIGDFAEVGNDKCEHFSLPIIKRIVGRERHLVQYPNGDKAWPSYNPMALYDLFPKGNFQIRQTSPATLVMKVSAAGKIDDDVASKAIAIVKEAIGYPFEIKIEAVESIPRSANGKFEEFMRDFNSSNA